MPIKFRSWDKATEEYLYSDKFPSMWQFFKELENRGIRHWEVEQFTGLKDKKRTKEYPEGQEIYDGDVVNNAKGYSYIVTWGPDIKTNNPNYTGWVMRAPDIKGSDFGANELFEWSKGNIEVIGKHPREPRAFGE